MYNSGPGLVIMFYRLDGNNGCVLVASSAHINTSTMLHDPSRASIRDLYYLKAIVLPDKLLWEILLNGGPPTSLVQGLAERLAEEARGQGFKSRAVDGRLHLLTRYDNRFVEAMRSIAGAQWVDRSVGYRVSLTPSTLLEVARAADTVYGSRLYEAWGRVLSSLDANMSKMLYVSEVVLSSDIVLAAIDGNILVARPGVTYDEVLYNDLTRMGFKVSRRATGIVYKKGGLENNALLRRLADRVLEAVGRASSMMNLSVVAGEELARLALVGGKPYTLYVEELSQAAHPMEGSVQDPSPPGRRLYPFQLATLEFLENHAPWRGVIIGDEMGLGKTVQALAYARIHPELRPMLVVVPSSVRYNWAREAGVWLPDEAGRIQVVSSGRDKPGDGASVVIVSYDLFSKHIDRFIGLKPRLVVFDESHYLKNLKAKRTKAALRLVEELEESGVRPRVLMLSGTPMVNSAVDIFPQLVLSGYLGMRDKRWFQSEFAEARTLPNGITVYRGFRNTSRLYTLLRRSGAFVRRRKDQVLDQLPEKRRIPTLVDIDIAEYRRRVNERITGFLERHKGKPLEQIEAALMLAELNYARQTAAELKVGPAAEVIANMALAEGKLVVFTYHRRPLSLLMDAVDRELGEDGGRYYTGVITGDTPASERQGIVDRFNSSENAVLYVNIRAGGVGLNLQTARVGVFFELDWTSAALIQAEDRLHRIGQKGNVDIYYLVAGGTVEEDMYRLAVEKEAGIQGSLDPEQVRKVFLGELRRVGIDVSRVLARASARGKRSAGRRRKR